jgi:hypothetical protein
MNIDNVGVFAHRHGTTKDILQSWKAVGGTENMWPSSVKTLRDHFEGTE